MGVKLLSRPIDNSNIAGSIKTEKTKIFLFFFSQKTLSTKQVHSSLIASEIVLNLPPFCTVIDILVNGTITQDKLQFVIISLGNESTKVVTNEAGKEKHGHSSASPTLLSNNLCYSLWMAEEGTDTPPLPAKTTCIYTKQEIPHVMTLFNPQQPSSLIHLLLLSG